MGYQVHYRYYYYPENVFEHALDQTFADPVSAVRVFMDNFVSHPFVVEAKIITTTGRVLDHWKAPSNCIVVFVQSGVLVVWNKGKTMTRTAAEGIADSLSRDEDVTEIEVVEVIND